ncbi:F-box protein SKIP14-like isoform X1 [Zingiber officinale]|nr:F-box protein SKIP14-like isoform X1 [Zingiber officinale]
MALSFPFWFVFSTPFIHTDDESSRAGCKRSPLNIPLEIGNGYGYMGGIRGDSDLVDVEWMFDPVDLLPDDPFGMGLDDSMEAAIASIFEASGGDLFGWTLLNLPEFQFYHGDLFEEQHSWVQDTFSGDGQPIVDVEPPSRCIHEETYCGNEGLLHDAFLYSLGHLNLQDLLSVEGVCRSLRVAVQSDHLLWRCIHLDSPLSEKFTDDVLVRFAQRSQGNLQCLSLSGCSKITNDGLKRVLDISPKLRKLNVSGCVRLSLDGIINDLKEFQSQGMPGIQHLKLGKLFVVSEEQYGELKSLLCLDQLQHSQPQKSRFYHTCRLSHHCDDNCVLDFDLCPFCEKYKLVYDCPSESCQVQGPKGCRACDVCISRCVQCGKCIRDSRYMETFCLEYLCSGCWSLPPSNEREEK